MGNIAIMCVDVDVDVCNLDLISRRMNTEWSLSTQAVSILICSCLLIHFPFTVFGYPGSYGGRCSNFWYYVQYNHPILSIYFVHPLHPFSRRLRCIAFLCSLSFAVCFAFILLDTPLVPLVSEFIL